MSVRIRVDIARQTLQLLSRGRVERTYRVSTALCGAGEVEGSGCTPCGLHRIRVKIGTGCVPGSVFVGRRPTGEVYSDELARAQPGRDWILTRILWLTGAEPGRNRGGLVDSLRRYIYIHGCPSSEPMGVPRSHGCIRMRNADVVELFDRVAAGDLVEIREADESY